MDKELPVSAWPEWKITEKIGEGSFGKVYKAQRTECGKSFYSAIKIINIPSSQSELNSVRSETGSDRSAREYFWNLVEECIQEISTMEYFRGNSHIVSVEDFKVIEYLDAIGWEISIRMEYLMSFTEYCAGKQLTEKEVLKLGLDLSKALEYCGKINIIHRDIKPENIFVSRFGDFKLGDFGIARELERSMGSFSKKGTYSYMAPEMYKGEKYDSRVDIYSLGIVLYKLMNRNRLPFMNLDKQLITYRDKENALVRRMSGEKMPKPSDAGEEFSRIILKACAFDPKDRYQTPEELCRALDDLKNERVAPVPETIKRPAQNDQITPSPGNRVNQPQNPTARSAARLAARKRRRKKRILRRALVFTIAALAILTAGGLYIRSNRKKAEKDPSNTLVDILENDKYSTADSPRDFSAYIERIKERATTITDNLDSYSWIGTEGDRILYLDNDTAQIMKALIYPARSEDKVYEEYFYWNEKLFFAYIWYDESKEVYYYDDNGNLIRWIDEDGNCHDNETDNVQYVKRGKKYWNRSVEALEGTIQNDVSD